jgi:hypothetical protein
LRAFAVPFWKASHFRHQWNGLRNTGLKGRVVIAPVLCLWEGRMLQYDGVKRYRAVALWRHVCLIVEVARRETNLDHRLRLLELAGSISRAAIGAENGD